MRYMSLVIITEPNCYALTALELHATRHVVWPTSWLAVRCFYGLGCIRGDGVEHAMRVML
jgi:hypothetical protein